PRLRKSTRNGVDRVRGLEAEADHQIEALSRERGDPARVGLIRVAREHPATYPEPPLRPAHRGDDLARDRARVQRNQVRDEANPYALARPTCIDSPSKEHHEDAEKKQSAPHSTIKPQQQDPV